MIVPVVAGAARRFCGRWFGLAATIGAAALLAAACLGADQAEVEVSQPQASQPQQAQVERPTPEPVAAEPTAAQPDPPTRTPRDAVRLLAAEAAALEHNGFWEQALTARESAIANVGSLDAAELASLRLDQVRLLLRLNRASEAQAVLTSVDAVTAHQGRRHALLSAQAALNLSDPETALEALTAYVNQDSPAWAMISLEVARALQGAGRGEEAVAWAERALGGTLPLQDRLRAIHLAATELDIAGEADRALAHYDELLGLSPWRADQAAALSRIGVLQRDAGQLEAAQVSWRRLVHDYPEFAESSEALTLLLESGAEVDQLTIGMMRFEEERWVEARHAMLTVLGGSNDVAEQVAGEFYIAAIHQANGDPESAALGYVAVIGRDQTHPLAAESAMRLAEFALAQGDQFAAEAYWRGVVAEHPDHARAPEAARRWASLPISRGEWSEAAQRFRDAANDGADYWDVEVRQELLFWAALMNREAGDPETAADLAAKVIDIEPAAYYGLRAAQAFGLDTPAALEISVEEWLERLTGEREPSRVDPQRESMWQAALDLRLGGFDDAADRVLSAWVAELASDPWLLVAASAFLAEQGEFSASARAAEQALTIFDLDWYEAPVELLRLAYPQPWPDVMVLHAATEGVEPSLLWSLIRRESFYDADAEGLAGEVGLTQVIPLTGSDIAAGLGVEYEHADLARPELAIRFGAWYLARQLEGFSSEPVMALAAYNAGPGNAARWEAEAVVSGVDGFLAALDYPSTRIYVRYVIESWAIYQELARAGQAD